MNPVVIFVWSLLGGVAAGSLVTAATKLTLIADLLARGCS